MRTKYYCDKCQQAFSEERLPNINKVHRPCGKIARIVTHDKVGKEEDEG